MQSPFTSTSDGVTWTHQPDDSYIVTGVTRAGKRFRFTTPHWAVAQCIHVWRGNFWLCRAGRRHLIARISN